jgi:hypothetical protein
MSSKTAIRVAPQIPEFRPMGIYLVSGDHLRISAFAMARPQVFELLEERMVDATGIEPVTPSV